LSNCNLELDFTADRNGEMPHPAVAQIFIKGSSSDENGTLRFITPYCLSISELDAEIDRLHAELEDIRRRGHARFIAEKITR
jgi:hypothetical protein